METFTPVLTFGLWVYGLYENTIDPTQPIIYYTIRPA
jgi:hypothetical protein